MPRAPIALFVYNRPDHTKATLKALAANSMARESELFVFSDGPKNDAQSHSVSEVRSLFQDLRGFKNTTLISRPENMGLAKSIITGVSEMMRQFGKAIILEDDIVTAPGFLSYMNEGLDAYKGNSSIFAISGWSPPIRFPKGLKDDIYLTHRAMCWGWGSWANRWEKIDWKVSDFHEFERNNKEKKLFARGGEDLPDMLRNAITGRVESWAIRWAYAQFRQNALSVAPVISLTENIGMDGTGRNCAATDHFSTTINREQLGFNFPKSPLPVPEIERSFGKFFAYNYKARIKKALGLL